MFTGIIAELGKVVSIKGNLNKDITVEAKTVLDQLKVGDSIAINGACQTATHFSSSSFTFFTSKETLEATNLGLLRIGDYVNLERPLNLSTLLDGHLIMGHVDDTAEIVSIKKAADSVQIKLAPPQHLMKYIISKGSVAMDGISLTVYQLDHSSFTVAIIPHTFEHTNLHLRKIGDRVNIETDLIAKYIEKLMITNKGTDQSNSITEGFLEKYGFLK